MNLIASRFSNFSGNILPGPGICQFRCLVFRGMRMDVMCNRITGSDIYWWSLRLQRGHAGNTYNLPGSMTGFLAGIVGFAPRAPQVNHYVFNSFALGDDKGFRFAIFQGSNTVLVFGCTQCWGVLVQLHHTSRSRRLYRHIPCLR